MTPAAESPFAEPLPVARARALPWTTVVAASLMTALPMIATLPVLPPFGLLMLLAWRLLARFALRPWAAAPLGFADDLVSGQPLGSAVLLWSLCFLAIDAIERRLVFRDFRQDWLIASGAIAFCLIGGRLTAGLLTAQIDLVLAAQIGASAALFPLAARVVAAIDRRRGQA